MSAQASSYDSFAAARAASAAWLQQQQQQPQLECAANIPNDYIQSVSCREQFLSVTVLVSFGHRE